MSRLPDLDAWAVFAKVAETGSFARAASISACPRPRSLKPFAGLEARIGASLLKPHVAAVVAD